MLKLFTLHNDHPYQVNEDIKGTGACAAMVAYWVKAILDHGGPITTEQQLTGSGGIDNFYEKSKAAHVRYKGYPYSPGSHTNSLEMIDARHKLFREAGLSEPGLQGNTRVGNFSYATLSFVGASGTPINGVYSCDVPRRHAVGMYIDSARRVFQLLEPEMGLFQTDDFAEDFVVALHQLYLEKKEPGLVTEDWTHRSLMGYRWPLP